VRGEAPIAKGGRRLEPGAEAFTAGASNRQGLSTDPSRATSAAVDPSSTTA
jgi:hypothetical protein